MTKDGVFVHVYEDDTGKKVEAYNDNEFGIYPKSRVDEIGHRTINGEKWTSYFVISEY